jgi:uncharacterized membrane protein
MAWIGCHGLSPTTAHAAVGSVLECCRRPQAEDELGEVAGEDGNGVVAFLVDGDDAWLALPEATTGQDHPAPFAPMDPRAGVRIAVCLVVGLVVVVVLVATGLGVIAAQGGWDAAALVCLAWMWWQVGPADAWRTAALAVREDASAGVSDVVLLLAAVASLAGVGDLILLGSASGDPVSRGPAIALAIRATALRHALLSYLFGAVIIAVTINLVAGLSK